MIKNKSERQQSTAEEAKSMWAGDPARKDVGWKVVEWTPKDEKRARWRPKQRWRDILRRIPEGPWCMSKIEKFVEVTR